MFDERVPEETNRLILTLADELGEKGHSMLEAVERLVTESADDVYRRFYVDARESVRGGGSFLAPLNNSSEYSSLFLSTAIELIRIGEQDGSLVARLRDARTALA